MELTLESLPHQQNAIEAILESIGEVEKTTNPLQNPVLKNAYDKNSFIDIKMETGTGKTYVYTRAMYELNKKYGFFKFIILVPNLAIKYGTQNFIEANSTKRHFDKLGLKQNLDLQIINSGDFAKKKRANMPRQITEFVNESSDAGVMQCLLINSAFLNKSSGFFKDDFERSLWNGEAKPSAAIANTKPVVLIDEPHKFNIDNKTYENLINELNPQLILRFGATFPNDKNNKIQYYQNKPQYELNALQAFNQNLIKGVEVYGHNLEGKKYLIQNVTNDKLTLIDNGEEHIFEKNNLLLGLAFEDDVKFEGGWAGQKPHLDCGTELIKGKILNTAHFSTSYQKNMIKEALNSHFAVEQENFEQQVKIKTNALFFISSIDSYRNKDGWLKGLFEDLLEEKIDELLEKDISEDYKRYLRATKNNIENAHGGYFAQDWGEADGSATLEEVKDILDKNRSLPFKNADGTWKIRRFFFSKWTLREGWDNPNVFTICKLRGSGSDINKIQEIGRGLRLPIDETGRRLKGQYYLHYHVNNSEKTFVQELLQDINKDNSTNETLASNKILNRSIIDNKVKLRKENWEQIRELWQKISKRYFIKFENSVEQEAIELFKSIIEKGDVFKSEMLEITKETIHTSAEKASSLEQKIYQNISYINLINYNEFAVKLAQATSIPIQAIHKILWNKLLSFAKEGSDANKYLNSNSLNNIIRQWQDKLVSEFNVKYNYKALNFTASTSIFKNNEFVEQIPASYLGTKQVENIEGDKRNLFDLPLYRDSELEEEIVRLVPKGDISVFGKLPRKAIRIPLYTGGTTTPDFIYYLGGKDKTLIIESKASEANRRQNEKIALEAHKKFFEKNKDIKYKTVTKATEVAELLESLLEN